MSVTILAHCVVTKVFSHNPQPQPTSAVRLLRFFCVFMGHITPDAWCTHRTGLDGMFWGYSILTGGKIAKCGQFKNTILIK